MSKLHLFWICGWLIICPGLLLAQERVVAGEILVSLKAESSPSRIKSWPMEDPTFTWTAEDKITHLNNIWRIRFNPEITNQELLLLHLKRHPDVRFVQLNHYVEERRKPENSPGLSATPYLPAAVVLPNDPGFELQWHLENNGQSGGTVGADLGAVPAWDITTGGVTPAGDTVVVAVIDGGICPYCEEFGSNLWVNHQEIPNDGIDNDGNGYFDDYRGWNVNAQDDNIIGYSSGHGTSVSGIIGAKGNNGIGITGIMWNTKLMFVAGTSGSQTTESQILSAYEYVWKARKTYNETNGAKGAYVVAVNCSFGINFTTPYQSPLWCEILDDLGEAGILTIGATANGSWNVDEVGDIPTTCPSDYLITTTSLDFEDEKALSASWGPISVDLGAYGSNIYTTTVGTANYGIVSGTSFAAPQVAAGIGLLFSAPCPNLISLSKENPGTAAITAKNILLSTVRTNASLNNLTVTGGRLQLYDMLHAYTLQCETCPRPYALTETNLDTNNVILSWVTTQDIIQVNLRWAPAGSGQWTELTNVAAPYVLHGLSGCTHYEYSLQSMCDSSQSSIWSSPKLFSTDGCCTPPDIESIIPTNNGAVIKWKPVTAAQFYNIKYKAQSANLWISIPGINSDSIEISGLESCSTVEVRIQTYCSSGLTNFSSSFVFQTTGCGACYDKTYCGSLSLHAGEEWIKSIEIGTWAYESVGFQGYQDFTGQSSIPLLTLFPEQTLQATVFPAFLGVAYNEMFRIYVDFNLDGDFEDPGELVFDPGFAHDGPLTSNFTTPYFISEGITRMRVIMKFKSSGFLNLPLPCETFDYGQVEDYCVALSSLPVQAENTPASPNLHVTLFPNPVKDHAVAMIRGKIGVAAALVTITDLNGRLAKSFTGILVQESVRIEDINALAPGMYLVKIVLDGQETYWGKMVKVL